MCGKLDRVNVLRLAHQAELLRKGGALLRVYMEFTLEHSGKVLCCIRVLTLYVLRGNAPETLLNANPLNVQLGSNPVHDFLQVERHLCSDSKHRFYTGHLLSQLRHVVGHHWVWLSRRPRLHWHSLLLLIGLLLGDVHTRNDLNALFNHCKTLSEALVEDWVVKALHIQLLLHLIYTLHGHHVIGICVWVGKHDLTGLIDVIEYSHDLFLAKHAWLLHLDHLFRHREESLGILVWIDPRLLRHSVSMLWHAAHHLLLWHRLTWHHWVLHHVRLHGHCNWSTSNTATVDIALHTWHGIFEVLCDHGLVNDDQVADSGNKLDLSEYVHAGLDGYIVDKLAQNVFRERLADY